MPGEGDVVVRRNTLADAVCVAGCQREPPEHCAELVAEPLR